MENLSLPTHPLWVDLVSFAVGGAVLWFAGTRLARLADTIGERSGLSRAFIGALMLGGVTSLPEIATTVSSSLAGNVTLGVNNVLGGVALQLALLAAADVSVRDVTLSVAANDTGTRQQGVALLLLLLVVAMGIVVGEPPGWPVGVWSIVVLVGCVLAFVALHRSGSAAAVLGVAPGDSRDMLESDEPPPRRLAWRTIVASVVVLVAGSVVALSGEAIAEKTPLGAGFVGVLFVAATTSLPELSTTIEAARLRRPDMVFGSIFGTNLFDLSLIAVIDVLWLEGPALAQVGRFSAFAALLGATLTCIYLSTLVTGRRGRTWGMGRDSIAVVVVYLAGMTLLYQLR